MLRTVFYSTINNEKEYVFCGKARISSYEDDGDIKQGTGQFGLNRDSKKMPVETIRGETGLHEMFLRTERGTDLYIIGYQDSKDDSLKKLIKPILNSFWAAIHFNVLEVELKSEKINHHIDSANLDGYMKTFASEPKDSNCFYQAVKKPSRFFKDNLKHLGEVELYVRVEETFPKLVQMMRKSKMVIFSKKSTVLPEQYAAVFLCESNHGNKILRGLEPPKHNFWEPKRDKENGHKVWNELYDWIKDSLRKLSNVNNKNAEEVPGLSEYLPLPPVDDEDIEMDADVGNSFNNTGSDIESATEVGKTQEQTPVLIHGHVAKKSAPIIKPMASGQENISKINKNKVERVSDSKNTVNPEKTGSMQRINTANLTFKSIVLGRNNKIMYQATFTASKHERGSIRLVAVGDDKNYPLNIKEVIDGNGEKVDVNRDKGLIMGIDLKPNQPLKLLIELNDNKRYVLEME